MLRDETGKVIGSASIGEDVTERARAEKQKRDALNFNHTIFEAAPVGILTYDQDGTVLSANAAAARLVGGTVKQLEAQNFRRLESWRRSGLLAAAERAIRIGREVELEVHLLTTFGKEAWLAFRLTPFEHNGQTLLLAVFSDIAERKKAEAALSESEQRFRQLAENIREVFWMMNPLTSELLYISPGYEAIWGRTCQSAYENSRGWLEAIHPEDRERIAEAALVWGTSRTYEEHYRIVRPDGSIRWIKDRAYPIVDQSGKVYRVVGIAEDVTERQQLEAQLQHAQKLEAIGTLAGGIAHDFNNILAAMMGYAEVAAMEAENQPQLRQYLAEVCKAGARAGELVRQILTFSRLQEQKRIPIQPRHVLAEALKLLRAASPASVQFVTKLGKDTPVILADSGQIHQIMMNLGTNAVHAMRERGGKLTTTLERVVVDDAMAARRADLKPGVYARLSVSDDGHGIDPMILQRIFEPFFTTKTRGEGTGLGLSVVHGIVQNHEGCIEVASEPGHGTQFRVYFPAVPEAEPVPEKVSEEIPRGAGEQILFVEDEAPLVDLGWRTLEKLGYSVTATRDPSVALRLVADNPGRFALVLADLTMPIMSGIQLAEKVHAIRPDLPILLMSGNPSNVDRPAAEAVGIRQIVLKPYNVGTLAQVIHSELNASPAGSSGSPRWSRKALLAYSRGAS